MVDTDTDDVECTLHIAKSISVFRIPPRPGSNGWRSGEWLVSDKLFTGRMRIVARGELCEIRLEDPNSTELFAVCPVHYGQRTVCVEPVTDSSRYYVLRVEDSATRRHAFLGMGFDSRGDAFDFNEALIRHEQQVARERAANAKLAGPGRGNHSSEAPAAGTSSAPASTGQNFWAHSSAAANSTAAAEVEGLYRQTAGLRLQEGQTIRVNVSGLKKSGATTTGPGAGGFLSGRLATQAPAGGLGPSAHPPAVGLIPPPPGPDAVPSPPVHGAASSAAAPLVAIPPPQILGGHPSEAFRPQVLPHPPSSLPAQDDGAIIGTGFRGNTDLPKHGFADGSSLGDGGSTAQTGGNPITTSAQDQWATFD